MLIRVLKRDWLLLAVLIAVTSLIALPVLTYPLGRDQGEFATIGRGILNGRVPYTELWNPKPPAVFYVYALAMRLLGQTVLSLRAIDFLVVPICCICLFWIGRHLANRRVGLWAALLFPVFYFTETFWTLTQNDGIVMVPILLALVCTIKAADQWTSGNQTANSRWVWGYAFVAGALAGYIVWYKYPFALFGVFLAITYVWIRNGGQARVAFVRRDALVLVAYVLGGLLTIGGGVLLLMSQGAWGEFLRSAQVTAQYTALTFNPKDFGDLIYTAIGYRWQHWGLLFVLAIIGLLFARKVVAGSQSPKAVLYLFLIWLLTGLFIMLVQAKGYDYHWLPMLPPLALLGAAGIEWVRNQAIRLMKPLVATAIISGLLVLILVVGIWPTTWKYLSEQEDQATYFGRFVAGEFVADESLKVAQLLHERVAVGDSLFIWGFRPEVYYLSGLNPATRFIFQFPLVGTWYPPEWRKETIDTLWAALPPYVLVFQVDYMPWVTGSHEDSNSLLQEYTELNNWLIFNYERETQIGNCFVWRRKPR